jgi:hypothetical protein
MNKITTFLLAFFLLLLTSPVLAQWTPPAGVPTPSFGISEVAPAPTVYVNEATGSDANLGTQAKPRRTIPAQLAAGTVVNVTGTQNTNYIDAQTLVSQGTQAKPVFIEGGTYTGTMYVKGSYLIFEKAIVRGGLYWAGTYSAIRDTEFSGGGIPIVDWLAPTPNHLVILRAVLHDIGSPPASWATGGDDDSHGIGVGKNVSYVWVLDSTFARVSGDGMQVNGEDRGAQTHHIYFARNTCDQNRQSCGWAKQSTDVVFSTNKVTRMRAYDNAGNPGQGFGAQYQATRVVFLKNDVSDSDYCIRTGGDTIGPFDVYVIGNFCHNIHSPLNSGSNAQSPGGAVVFTNNGDRRVIVNTITDADTGIGIANSGGSVEIVNNTITQVTHPGVYESPQPTFTTDLVKIATDYQQWHGVPLGVDLGVAVPPPPPPPGLPDAPSSPTPANGATGVAVKPTLKWVDANATSYALDFGNATGGGTVPTTTTSYTLTTALAYSTTYYWRIRATNASGTTTGAIWTFTTMAAPTLPACTTTGWIRAWQIYLGICK